MYLSLKKYTLIAVILLIAIVSCNKYKDPPRKDRDERLDNPYCNDPIAINYNWGFPGVPNNDVCIYPTDPFEGSWIFTDTIYFSDSAIASIETYSLNFSPVHEDSLKSKIAVYGWCSNEPFFIIADKFLKATTDTTDGGLNMQIICNPPDSIYGSFAKYDEDSLAMRINLTVNNQNGIRVHSGTAVKN
jgi:hypothetical protein